jgi:uncharacterized membrane protein YeaQ/YmgE (transglycosylase-associated protein family)
MTIGGWLSAIGVGLLIGYVGRFVAPKNRGHDIGLLLTILIGVVSALLGTTAAKYLHVHAFVLVFAIQVVVAALFVTAFARLDRRNGS